MSLLRLIVIVGTAVLMVVLWMIVSRTRIGKAMRATSVDRDAAAMMGIDVDRVIVFTFVLGSALAGAGGVLFAMRSDVYPQMGFIVGLTGFVAAVIGGIGSIPGRDARRLPARVRSSRYTQTYITTQWSNLVIFSVLIVFMLVRPQGLLGRPDIRKV